jgi:sulfite exporter TauE/SafE
VALLRLLLRGLGISPAIQSVLQMGLGAVMVILGLNNLGLVKSLSLPVIFGEKILDWKNNTRAWWLPMALGVSTFILPCGFTQSMQLYALSLGNPLRSALTMLMFSLGTLPVLSIMSAISVKFNKGRGGEIFFKTVGFLLIAFGVWQMWVGGRG